MPYMYGQNYNNLPMGVVVNRTIITPTKFKHVPVILMNTNSYNVWIHWSLLAANVVEADHCPWDYQPFLCCEGDEVEVTFHPVPSSEVQEELLSSAINNSPQSDSNSKEQGNRSKFRPQPKFNSPRFQFQVELKILPFPIN